MASKEELMKMTVADLRTELKKYNQPVTGKKDELVERLIAAQEEGGAATAPAAAAAAEGNNIDAAAAGNGSAEPEGSQDPAADEIGSVAEAGAAAAAAPGAPADASAAPSEASGKREKIVFDEAVAAKMPDTSKLVVVKPAAEAAKPKLSEVDRLKARADRFKDPEVDRVKQRAARFGVPHPELEKERALKRAERFGTFHPELEEEKKKKRAEKFGIEDPEAKLAARADRFRPLPTALGAKPAAAAALSNSDFEAQKKARAARFGAAA